MNRQLTRVITSEEVKRDVFEMPADKSLGLDEELICLLREAEMKKGLTAIKISRESPIISHILFADDTMIFYKAS
ncbi:hypothetical protein LIER_42842 [Lithospermum erythrorhizon]|uniref:Reverse transcriptase n=1 Tax=Lithospermum erythrorhizon TaxID=34254 RepID=A0AAV3P078_LITER